MTPGTLPDLVQTLIVEHLGIAGRFSWDADLAELGADKLTTVDLTQLFDERFHIAIDDHSAERCRTAGDWLEVVRGRVL